MRNEQDIVARRKGGLEIKISFFHFLRSLFCSFTFEVLRTFVALYFAFLMT
jgi:hypothetical protein